MMNASVYADNAVFQEKQGFDLIHLAQICGGELVLDIGCGTGKLTHAIYQQQQLNEDKLGGLVVGIDPDADRIAYATSHFTNPESKNLRFLVGHACHLVELFPEFSSAVDVIFCSNTLHWVMDKEVKHSFSKRFSLPV